MARDKKFYDIGDPSFLNIPKDKTVDGAFAEMDTNKDGKLTRVEIDPDLDAYVKYKKKGNNNRYKIINKLSF